MNLKMKMINRSRRMRCLRNQFLLNSLNLDMLRNKRKKKQQDQVKLMTVLMTSLKKGRRKKRWDLSHKRVRDTIKGKLIRLVILTKIKTNL